VPSKTKIGRVDPRIEGDLAGIHFRGKGPRIDVAIDFRADD
jgi:hypothetical protein